MEKGAINILIFLTFFIISLIYWRVYVSLFYKKDNISPLRSKTKLNIHHYHWGIVFMVISFLMILFDYLNSYSIALMGFGVGSTLDSFIYTLFLSHPRKLEIETYNKTLILTIKLFAILALLIGGLMFIRYFI